MHMIVGRQTKIQADLIGGINQKRSECIPTECVWYDRIDRPIFIQKLCDQTFLATSCDKNFSCNTKLFELATNKNFSCNTFLAKLFLRQKLFFRATVLKRTKAVTTQLGCSKLVDAHGIESCFETSCKPSMLLKADKDHTHPYHEDQNRGAHRL